MDNLDDFFLEEPPIDIEKVKKNFKNLKETFDKDPIMREPKEYTDNKLQELKVEDSKLNKREWGIVSFYAKNSVYRFRTIPTAVKLDPVEGFSEIRTIWPSSNTPPRVSVNYTVFDSFGIVFRPKFQDTHPNYLVNSVEELLYFYNLYREVPNTLKYHDKHGKEFPKNSYFMLELIK